VVWRAQTLPIGPIEEARLIAAVRLDVINDRSATNVAALGARAAERMFGEILNTAIDPAWVLVPRTPGLLRTTPGIVQPVG